MDWLLMLTVFCTNPGPGPCPAHAEIAAQPHYIAHPTLAQCEELRDFILGQQPAPDMPRGFVLDAQCVRSGGLLAPTGLRVIRNG